MIIDLQHKAGRIQRVANEILGLSRTYHGGACGEIGILIVIRIKAIALVVILRGKQTDIKGISDVGALIIIARILLHMHGDAHDDLARKHAVRSLVCREQRTVDYGDLIVHHVLQGAQKRQAADLILRSGCNKGIVAADHVASDVDHLGKLAHLTRGNDIHQILEGKAARIHDLDIADLGIAGLPFVVIKGRGRRIAFGILPVNTVLGPIHFNVQHACLDHVAKACDLIAEPGKGGTKQHGKTKDQCHKTCQ